MPHNIMNDMLRTICRLPEMPVNPPDPQPNPQITRDDYEHHSPQERLEVIRELLIALSEVGRSLKFLNESDPDTGNNFPGAIGKLNEILDQVLEYQKDKVVPWLDK